MTTGTSVAEVVRSDLCIGCGLCEAVSGGRVRMRLTVAGSLRPTPVDGFRGDEEARVLAACPGTIAATRDEPGAPIDDVWGAHLAMWRAWAGDDEVRFRSSSGGVLTALGRHLLRTGRVEFVLHVGADPDHPARTRWVMSETPAEVLANSGSRYEPAAPLAGLGDALDREVPFAIVAKPCDLGAVHRWASCDERVDRYCVTRLALVCGGQSRMTKTLALLDGVGVTEPDVASLRYRGNGNPGPTRVETNAGTTHEVSYLDMWADESGWDVETRCKLCPDALGEAADVAVADAWPGGAPVGEDDGFNAIIVRTSHGRTLIDDAGAAGDIVLGDALNARLLDALQPHQVRKKIALAARYEGLSDAGVRPIEAIGLRIDELGSRLDAVARTHERVGTARRIVAASR